MGSRDQQGSRSYAFRIDFFAEAQLARLYKTMSYEIEVAADSYKAMSFA
jgi:hypothetical protein